MTVRTRKHMTDKEMVRKLIKTLKKEGRNPTVDEVVWNRAGLIRTEYEVSYDLVKENVK